jgi:enterochelin esterase-like enzyme
LPAAVKAGARQHARWHVVTLHLSDPVLRIGDRTVYVALPPGYDHTRARFPVVYLFSGYPGRPSDWLLGGRATQTVSALVHAGLTAYPILVCPDVNGGFFTDSETLDAVGGSQVQTWVTRDVVGYVDGHYRTLTDRANRVVGGMSSGGYAALNVGLRYQDEFGSVLAMEPYGDPGNVLHSLLRNRLDLYQANSPSYYLPTVPLHRRIDVFMDVGSDGGDVARVERLARLLAARGEPVALRLEAGQGHTWSEAVQGLPYALAFVGRHLGEAQLDRVLPSSLFPAVSTTARIPLQTRPTGVPECWTRGGHAALVRARARHYGGVVCRGPATRPPGR